MSKIKQNPVRDYRSVEEGYSTTPCMPLGMQPIFRNVVAFLRNAGVICGYNFLPSDIPYGNKLVMYAVETQWFISNLTAMVTNDYYFRHRSETMPNAKDPFFAHKLSPTGRFNQAEAIAKGVGKLTGIVVCLDLVARKKQNQTQTKKGRYARWLNAIDIFVTGKKDGFNYNHILIVDDVLTTGATVEACAQSILQSYPDVKISVLTLAVTE